VVFGDGLARIYGTLDALNLKTWELQVTLLKFAFWRFIYEFWRFLNQFGILIGV
jgi:hypothetical protein